MIYKSKKDVILMILGKTMTNNVEIVNTMIKEIEQNLQNKCYLSALMLALIIPDICSCAENGYTKETIGERKRRVGTEYKDWCRKYIINEARDKYEISTSWCIDKKLLQFNEDVIYSLRNKLLHNGNPNTDRKIFEDSGCNYENMNINLIFKDDEIYDEISSSIEGWGEPTNATLNIPVGILCFRIVIAAKTFIRENAEKFKFFDYQIIL